MIDAGAFTKTLNGKPVAVFGLARSGLAVIKALKAAGAEVKAWDDQDKPRKAAVDLSAEVTELTSETLTGCACLVLAPGVPLHFPEPHDVVKAANEAGVEIIGDIELLHRCGHSRKTIGITGTNGKSTTTAILDHVLRECGISVACGGNIGNAVFDLDLPEEDGVFVLELSSFQLDLCPTFSPDIAVLLNISADHLDRHGTMENYIAAKERIFRNAKTAIVGTDDQDSAAICERVGGIPISMKDDFGAVDNPNLRGDHNRQNMAAAFVVTKETGCKDGDILAAFQSYPGLPHRQFLVHEIGGVLYVNDSKATNAEAAEKALKSYDDIYWIVGGQAKEGGLKGLENLMSHVKHSFLIGEAAAGFSAWMDEQGAACTVSGTLEQAVAAAHEMAQDAGKGVVLLSPACASFDQFESFEHRGDEFVKLVGELQESAAA